MHMNVGGEAAGQFCDSLLSAVSSAHFNLEKSYRGFEEEKKQIMSNFILLYEIDLIVAKGQSLNNIKLYKLSISFKFHSPGLST